jgi:hypothetical protein
MIVFIQPSIIVFTDKKLEWLIDTSSGCNWFVMPLGIITILVFLFLILFLILLERWPWNAFIASILHGFDNTSGRRSHTYPSQSSINSDVIHAFFYAWTTASSLKLSFGTVFLFNIMYGGNLFPFAVNW